MANIFQVASTTATHTATTMRYLSHATKIASVGVVLVSVGAVVSERQGWNRMVTFINVVKVTEHLAAAALMPFLAGFILNLPFILIPAVLIGELLAYSAVLYVLANVLDKIAQIIADMDPEKKAAEAAAAAAAEAEKTANAIKEAAAPVVNAVAEAAAPVVNEAVDKVEGVIENINVPSPF